MVKKFKNIHDKLSNILSVFGNGESLSAREISDRVAAMGYRVSEAHLRTFIYHNMLYKYLTKEQIDGKNRYSILS
jgi:repressor of nif and glnA expression